MNNQLLLFAETFISIIHLIIQLGVSRFWTKADTQKEHHPSRGSWGLHVVLDSVPLLARARTSFREFILSL